MGRSLELEGVRLQGLGSGRITHSHEYQNPFK